MLALRGLVAGRLKWLSLSMEHPGARGAFFVRQDLQDLQDFPAAPGDVCCLTFMHAVVLQAK